MSFHNRLSEVMNRRKVNSADLARLADVSGAAVSGWKSGSKMPSVDKLARIAELLGVTPGYLTFGEGTDPEPSSAELQPFREDYEENAEWYWRPAPRDRGRELGNAAAYAFETDIANLARESTQNISDEKLSTAPTVEARFTVSELTGEPLESFLRAIKFSSVRPHLDAARESNRKAGNVIGQGLDQLDAGRLNLIRIEDFNANGLTGPEFDTGRFMAVVRNVLDSQKGDSAAGGSFGLGWATLPASSQFGLVFCNSTLSIAESGKSDGRFIGVIDLPWHAIGDKEYAGRGWYGREDPTDTDAGARRTVSYWGNEALLRDALVHRVDPRPGTSFLIVGAYDASGTAEDIGDIAEKFSESLADNFWPAMIERPDRPARLQVIVRADRNGIPILERYVNPAQYQPAKVAAFTKHLNDDVVESLDESGEVVRRKVTLRVPRRTSEPSHNACEHEAVLLVAQAGDEPDGRPETAPGTITYLRGSHMVIQTPRVGALPIGARSFHAIVLAGEAAGDAAADRAADRLLRASEPPSHNKWTGTAEVTTSYVRGAKTAIEQFDAEVKKAVREIIRQPSRDLSDGPEALKELLRLVPPTPTSKRPSVKGVRDHAVDADGAWVITEATVTLPARKDKRGWTITPVLRFGSESGAAIPVQWAVIEPIERCELDDRGRLVTAASARTATFTATSDPSSHPVGARRAKVLIDVRVHADGAN